MRPPSRRASAATLALPRGAAQEGRQSVAELGRRDVRAITDAPWPPGRSMASWTRMSSRSFVTRRIASSSRSTGRSRPWRPRRGPSSMASTSSRRAGVNRAEHAIEDEWRTEHWGREPDRPAAWGTAVRSRRRRSTRS